MTKGREEKTGTANHRWSKVEIALWVYFEEGELRYHEKEKER